MLIVNTHEAKSQLSQLIEKTLAGENVVIARSGRPVVKLVPHTLNQKPRIPGKFRGKILMVSGFTDESEVINQMFS